MQAIRKRVPFHAFRDDDSLPSEAESERILDEQEQEEVIASLKKQSDTSNSRLILSVQIVVGLSLLLHIIHAFNSARGSPLLTIFPTDVQTKPVIFSPLLSCLAVFIHINLLLSTKPHLTSETLGVAPISYSTLFMISAIAPVLCLIQLRPWQITVWWCVPGAITFLAMTVRDWVDEGNMNILELEKLKYIAPGA